MDNRPPQTPGDGAPAPREDRTRSSPNDTPHRRTLSMTLETYHGGNTSSTLLHLADAGFTDLMREVREKMTTDELSWMEEGNA
jgi:hypothetical protein